MNGTGRRAVDWLIRGGQVVTVAGHREAPAAGEAQGEIGVIDRGLVALAGDEIVAVGPATISVPTDARTQVVDATGMTVLPGFVDSHTHLVFAGWRAAEFDLRVNGASYTEILQAGGGILETVRATRAASQEQLTEDLRARLEELLSLGTTTVEVKSGYGLRLEDELKQLRAIRALQSDPRYELIATCLAAHAVPPEFVGDASGFARHVAEVILPAVAEDGLAEYADVFCEDGVFDAADSRLVLEAARTLGLGLKIHADEIRAIGGAALAAELGAVSADHLAVTRRQDWRRLAEAGTVACLLPGTSFYLMKPLHAPARGMVAAGVPLALASDYNPGTFPSGNLGLVWAIACLTLRLSPAEALVALTINGAHAIRRAERIGSLEAGKQADVVLWPCAGYEEIPYRLGQLRPHAVWKRGRLVAGEVAPWRA